MRLSPFPAGLAALSLVLCLLSLPGGPLPLLALVSLVPLGLALCDASRAECLVYAYVCGFLGWLQSAGGLASGLSMYARLPRGEALLLVAAGCAWLAVPYGAFGLLYGTFQWMKGTGGALRTAACLTLLVSVFPSPLPLDSSHSLYRFPILVQILDLGGQPLLLFALYLFNWLWVDVALRIRQRRDYRSSSVWLLGLSVFVAGYGCFRVAQCQGEEAQHPPDRWLRIAIVQPDIPLGGDSNPHSEDALNPFHTLLEMSAGVLAKDHSIELVVWPETPARITCEDDSRIRPQLTAIAARYGVPFLINCVQAAPGGGDYNTELLLDRRRTYAYHKQRLFPFTEYIPGERWFPGLRALIPGVSRYAEGRDATVFRIKGPLGVFPAICYEALFPGHVRQFVGQGGNILISAANDAWFGRSRIPEFAIAESVYQAVQYRIPVVRVSNSGDSLAVKASGIIVPGSRTAAFTKTTRAVEVFAPRTRSPYLTLGNLFLYVLAAGWLIAVLRDLWKARARGGATGGPQS